MGLQRVGHDWVTKHSNNTGEQELDLINTRHREFNPLLQTYILDIEELGLYFMKSQKYMRLGS